MSRIQQTIIYEEGTCGPARETDEPTQKSFSGVSDVNYFAEIRGTEPTIKELTCDSDAPLLPDDIDLLSCEICKDVCVKQVTLIGQEKKHCSSLSQQVAVEAELKKEYTGSSCYVKIKLVPEYAQGDLTEAYVLLKATDGSSELNTKNVMLNNGTWTATANFKEESSSESA